MKLSRVLAMITVLGMVQAVPACRSADKGTPESAGELTPPSPDVGASLHETEPKTGKPVLDCNQPPVMKACCEALTPKCNDCREENRKLQDDWNAKCTKPSLADAPCGSPPAIECCNEDTNDCRACREKALNELLAWTKKCGTDADVNCAKQPIPVLCCQAMTPSCDACRDRSRRTLEDWHRRCDAKSKGAQKE
jgi:hypothetical protein